MKILRFLLLTSFLGTSIIYAQNPEWIQYVHHIHQGEVNCISLEGNTVWIGTDGGLIELETRLRKFNLF